MHRIFLLPAVILFIAGCTQNKVTKTTQPNTEGAVRSTTDTLCFSRYSGSKNQDTAYVKLIVDGDQVSGDFSNYPYEKDSRVGTITGVKSDGAIKGIWTYQQEGINDSIPFEFKLKDSQLLQRQTSYDQTTGKEFLSDTANFSVEFTIIDCEKSKQD